MGEKTDSGQDYPVALLPVVSRGSQDFFGWNLGSGPWQSLQSFGVGL